MGFEAVHTGEVGLATASDRDILVRAEADDRIVVTLDADFHAIIALSGATKPSVIRVRIEGVRGPELSEIIMRTIQKCETELRTGAIVSVGPRRLRLRRLPLHPR
ncbi:MAG: DUF5615 family PIN-like protein [Planctomycetota bacterium]